MIPSGADSSKIVAPKSSKLLAETGSVAFSFLLGLLLSPVRHQRCLLRSRRRRAMARVRAKQSCLEKWTMTLRGESLRATYRFRCEYRDLRLHLLDRRVLSSLVAFDWGTLEWRGVLLGIRWARRSLYLGLLSWLLNLT